MTRAVYCSNGREQTSIGIWYRIFKVVCPDADTLGDLYIAEQGTLKNGVPEQVDLIHDFIPLKNSTSTKAAYTVPGGRIMHITQIYVETPSSSYKCPFSLQIRPPGGDHFINIGGWTASYTGKAIPFKPPLRIEGLSEVRFINSGYKASMGINIGYLLTVDD